MQYTTTITSKGQMTIPVAIRRKLGLKPGPVRITAKGGSVKIEQDNWQEDLAALQARVREHLQKHNVKPLTDVELDRAINDAAEKGVAEQYLRGR